MCVILLGQDLSRIVMGAVCISLLGIQPTSEANDRDITWEKDAVKLQVSEFDSLPGVIRLDLGVLRCRSSYKYELPIRNGSDKAFHLAKAKSSCKCILGVIPDTVLVPGQKTTLRLQVSPGNGTKQFKRTLALLGPEGSGKHVALQIEAVVKDCVSFEPSIIEFSEEHEKKRITLSTNFDLTFDDDIKVDQSECLDWRLVSATPRKAIFEVQTRKLSSDWGTGVGRNETIVLRPESNSPAVQLRIPFRTLSRPVIKPNSLHIREDRTVKFFLLGSIKLLGPTKGKINLVIENQESEIVGQTLTKTESERLATCIVAFSSKEIRGFAKTEEFLVRNADSSEVVGQLNISFE